MNDAANTAREARRDASLGATPTRPHPEFEAAVVGLSERSRSLLDAALAEGRKPLEVVSGVRCPIRPARIRLEDGASLHVDPGLELFPGTCDLLVDRPRRTVLGAIYREPSLVASEYRRALLEAQATSESRIANFDAQRMANGDGDLGATKTGCLLPVAVVAGLLSAFEGHGSRLSIVVALLCLYLSVGLWLGRSERKGHLPGDVVARSGRCRRSGDRLRADAVIRDANEDIAVDDSVAAMLFTDLPYRAFIASRRIYGRSPSSFRVAVDVAEAPTAVSVEVYR